MGVHAMGNLFQVGFHVPGTLSADVSIKWTAPCDCQLLHVSAVGSNENNGLITVGDSADADEYVQSSSIGDSGTPVDFDYDDFYDSGGSQPGVYYPHIAAGTIVAIALDYDGSNGTATDDFTVVLTFSEG